MLDSLSFLNDLRLIFTSLFPSFHIRDVRVLLIGESSAFLNWSLFTGRHDRRHRMAVVAHRLLIVILQLSFIGVRVKAFLAGVWSHISLVVFEWVLAFVAKDGEDIASHIRTPFVIIRRYRQQIILLVIILILMLRSL